MADELSILSRRKPDKKRAQWVLANYVKLNTSTTERGLTRVLEVPLLMPCTVIFVHGVNSSGEWYEFAGQQICDGLNRRLGRRSLEGAKLDDVSKRLTGVSESGQRVRSPIIPFYWGYKAAPGDLAKYPGTYHDSDDAWDGGPFQNGTNSLLQFWQGGFKRKLMHGLVDLERLNSDFTRQLNDAPPRTYMIHAAKRLAYLIDTIREDFPDEPVNVVAHSQGNMITLCAMLFVKQRAPDTLILNGAPYAFDTKMTDWLAAAHGWAEVQSSRARIKTFQAIGRKIAAARTDYMPSEQAVDCPVNQTNGAEVLYVQRSPRVTGWEADIGTGAVNDHGQRWQDVPLHCRDNRGKIFVNFCPHDRVIGISAIEGIGWRGIPEKLLSDREAVIPNVYQRIFVRNCGSGDVPAVGAKSGYWFRYFYLQHKNEDVATGTGAQITTSDGTPVRTENDYVVTHDGKSAWKFWNVVPEKILGVVGVQGTPDEVERVWINAPEVPQPATIDDAIDEGKATFDGSDGDPEQEEEFRIFARHYVDAETGQPVLERPISAKRESRAETAEKLKQLGKQQTARTNHGQILTYGRRPGQARLVEQVLSYDLTVGQGYAFGDHAYWQYLLQLADWRISDPYCQSGVLTTAGPFPAGLDTGTAGLFSR